MAGAVLDLLSPKPGGKGGRRKKNHKGGAGGMSDEVGVGRGGDGKGWGRAEKRGRKPQEVSCD